MKRRTWLVGDGKGVQKGIHLKSGTRDNRTRGNIPRQEVIDAANAVEKFLQLVGKK